VICADTVLIPDLWTEIDSQPERRLARFRKRPGADDRADADIDFQEVVDGDPDGFNRIAGAPRAGELKSSQHAFT